MSGSGPGRPESEPGTEGRWTGPRLEGPVRALFVTDLDGTLLDPQRRVHERNRAAIRRANEEGVAVAIATGRRQSTIRPEYPKLEGLRFRVAASNGSVVLAPCNHLIESVRSLEWSLVDELAADEAFSHAPVVCITTGEKPSLPPDGPPDCFVLQPGSRAWTRTWRWTDPQSFEPAEVRDAHAQRLVHVAVHLAARDEAERLAELLAPRLPATAEQHVVVAPYGPGALLEVVPAGGKAQALRYFAERFGVAAEATAAIGDEINDLVLLDAAAYPFAVGRSVLAERRPGATEVSEAGAGAVADALEEFLRRLG